MLLNMKTTTLQLKLTKEGHYIMSFGSKGSAPGQLRQPNGLAVFESLIFISEGYNNHVSVFSTEGVFMFCFGKKGGGYGEFNMPWGVVVDKLGNLYVSDKDNNRIVVYELM